MRLLKTKSWISLADTTFKETAPSSALGWHMSRQVGRRLGRVRQQDFTTVGSK